MRACAGPHHPFIAFSVQLVTHLHAAGIRALGRNGDGDARRISLKSHGGHFHRHCVHIQTRLRGPRRQVLNYGGSYCFLILDILRACR